MEIFLILWEKLGMIENDFISTFELEKDFKREEVEEFKKDCGQYLARNIMIDDFEKLKTLSLFFSRHLKRELYAEYKNHPAFGEFVEAYGATPDDMQKISKKIELKNSNTKKIILSQAKTELPMRLMNILEVEMGGLIKSDGEPMTLNEYISSTGISKDKAALLIKDAKEIVKQKVKRRGFNADELY